MAVSTAERADSRRGSGGGEFLLVGAGLAATIAAALLLGKGQAAPPPPACSCGACASGGSVPLAAGLYVTCSVTGNPDSCTIWRVGPDPGGSGETVRWGYTTPAQLARCEGASPVVHGPGGFSFGNGDTGPFIGTVGDIAVGCACPPGSLHAGTV